ncbi:response regulator transcription factor [Anaerocolumna chitinilytica]|uniref:HTH luxR-type domain-containing protein n=1 Tax=Anaerocolumna chitinilytica TaxID=1727145 RepID=A0A7I8DG20_9FIRM|nr:LuxR C-terminal-related transcriptional regulator [Anaerocolumna chitinilytica]BCJ97438.1 hypothetical protein bsdcttw_04790 [Anaerocolumna chitinilytica]
MKSDYEVLIRQNEYETNEKVSRAARIILYFELVIAMLCWLKIFDISESIVIGAIAATLVPLLLPVLMVEVLHIEKAWVKYILIASLAAVTGIYYIFLTFQVVLLFILPTIVAALYLEKNVLYFCYGSTVAAILLSHLITGFWLMQPLIEPFTGLKAIMLYGALPRLMEYFCCAVIIQILVSHCRKYIGNIYPSSGEAKADLPQAVKGNTADINLPEMKTEEGVKLEAIITAETKKNEREGRTALPFKAELNKREEAEESSLQSMTDREIEICRLLALGYTNAHIAKQLFLSGGTVKNYVSAIYEKTGIKDRTALALMLNRYFNKYDSGHIGT